MENPERSHSKGYWNIDNLIEIAYNAYNGQNAPVLQHQDVFYQSAQSAHFSPAQIKKYI
jgi:hypothetical protein